MKDRDCMQFLQWALPRLDLHWPGFRKVRKQVCKRIGRRLGELRLPDVMAYRRLLESEPDEWPQLARLCRITISRFYRDRRLFVRLGEEVLPALADLVRGESRRTLRCWSVGCASGEEPYTLALVWEFVSAADHPDLDVHILATDVDPVVLARAGEAIYPASSLKDLPDTWRRRAFEPQGSLYRLREEHRRTVSFSRHDVRDNPLPGEFELILCRNLVFTYFTPELQRRILTRLRASLVPEGVLVLGAHETLPAPTTGFTPWPQLALIQRRRD